MSHRHDANTSDRREFLKLAGAAVGGAILLPYGCSESDVGVSTGNLSTDYQFFKVIDSSTSGIKGLQQITPGIMINDQSRILFYGDNGDDSYGLYELTIDYGSGSAPRVERSRVVTATGQSQIANRTVQRIHRADTNSDGNIAVLLDFYEDGSGPADPQALATVFMESNGEMNRIVGFGDRTPDGGVFGSAFGDLALHDNNDLLIVAHFANEAADPHQGVFALPGASSNQSQLLLNSGTALEGRSNSIARAFGLVDLHDAGNVVAQTQVASQARTLGTAGAGSGSQGALVQGASGLTSTIAQPRILSAPSVFGLSAAIPGEVVMGPRAGADGAAAWIVHAGDGDNQQLFFRSNSRPTTQIATTGGTGGIYSFSAPVLSDNGMLFYLQINKDSDPPIELKAVGSGAPTTILAVGQQIEKDPITGLMHGYHSQQADSEGRVVAYAEFGEGNAAILVGIPS